MTRSAFCMPCSGFMALRMTPRFERLGINLGSLVFMHVNRNILVVLSVCILSALFLKNSNEMSHSFRPNWRNAAFIVIMAVYTLLSINNVTEFLYFNF